MAKAIDLENTIKELEGLSEHPFVMTDAEIKFFLAQQPTIDPVKHGKWKYDEDVKALYCVCCGIFAQPQRKTNYCPHCGADMRGDQE